MSISVTWHGHATLSLNVNGHKMVVDPFFNDNPAARTRVEDVEADFILLTHGHFDHVGDVVELAKRTGALVIANPEICGWVGERVGVVGHGQNTGGAYQHPFGHLKMTPALHSSGLPDGSYGGLAGGYLLVAGGRRIYIAGDTALFSDMQLIGRAAIDLAILPIGDNFTMGPDDALLAVGYLRPKAVMPYHCDTWPLIEVDVDLWAKRVAEQTDAEPIVLGVDESFTV